MLRFKKQILFLLFSFSQLLDANFLTKIITTSSLAAKLSFLRKLSFKAPTRLMVVEYLHKKQQKDLRFLLKTTSSYNEHKTKKTLAEINPEVIKSIIIEIRGTRVNFKNFAVAFLNKGSFFYMPFHYCGGYLSLSSVINNQLLLNFYWPRYLSQKCRMEESIILHKIIFDLQKLWGDSKFPHLTICGHSHGGNIGLMLAGIEKLVAKECQIKKINRLFMFGTPLQLETEQYLYSTLFGQLVNFYSNQDNIQNRDWLSTKYISTRKITSLPENSGNFKQVRIEDNFIINKGNVGQKKFNYFVHSNLWILRKRIINAYLNNPLFKISKDFSINLGITEDDPIFT